MPRRVVTRWSRELLERAAESFRAFSEADNALDALLRVRSVDGLGVAGAAIRVFPEVGQNSPHTRHVVNCGQLELPQFSAEFIGLNSKRTSLLGLYNI
jgi:hypothetical protein